MHTLRVPTRDDGVVSVHHNGDWSGDVMITFEDPKRPALEFPAAVLQAVANAGMLAAFRQKVVSFVENLNYPTGAPPL